MTKDRNGDTDDETTREGTETEEEARAEEEAPDGEDTPDGEDADAEDSAAEDEGEDEDADAEDSAAEDEGEDEDADGAEDEGDDEDAQDEGEDEDADAEDSAAEDEGEDDDADEKVAAKEAAADRGPSQDRTRLLILGAVLLGVAAFAGLWWSNQGGDTEDESSDAEASEAADELMSTPEETPSNPFQQGAQPQGPQPIPAPPDVAAPPEDAERSESGLAWRVLEQGEGTGHPGESDLVTMEYTGWTTDGRMVDSSVARGEPATFPLERGIPGWVEGVQMMVKGEKRRFWVPPELAATQRGRPPGPIVFDIELLDFGPAPEPPPAPRDVSGPPPSAEHTESGLAYRVLEQGTGTEHPSPTSRVRVNFSSWTTDGELLDTSVTSGEPALLPPLRRVLPGMREGIEQMVVGEKRRLWIPQDLAFAGRPGAPEGMLVFDVELVEIIDAPPMPMFPGHPGGQPGGGQPGPRPPAGHPPMGPAPAGHPPMGGSPPG